VTRDEKKNKTGINSGARRLARRSSRRGGSLVAALKAGGLIRGSILDDGQITQEAEVQDPASKPLPDLRPASRIPGQIQDVPFVFPATGAQGGHPRRDQVKLVGWED
jgi:hypothetical protein